MSCANKKGLLIVVSGPAGSGKGTVLSRLLADDNYRYSVSATTRAPRPGEVDGVNYHFLTKERFEELISADRFLEYAQYAENYYGTPLDPVLDQLEQGNDVILEIELQGALQVKKRMPQAVLVFIAPPSFEELEDRLRGRGTESEEVILRRLAIARQECANMDQFRYIVVNDEVADAADRLRAVILSQRCLQENCRFTLK
jgi:guanylate kinase